ncbi:hypothetical protein V5799_000793 [Amblyomma americanum]|uniref:Uncharacterized protein n=1 Tax=Amblyomma americanum TaxID=6943 RepID=A0AAQ4D210_AMBAM
MPPDGLCDFLGYEELLVQDSGRRSQYDQRRLGAFKRHAGVAQETRQSGRCILRPGRPEIGHAFPGRTGRQLNPKRESRCSASRALWTAFFKTPAPSHSRREWRFHLLQQQRRPAHGGLHAEAATGKRVALRRCSDILPAGPAQQSSQSENGGPTGAQGPCLHIPEVTSKRDAFPLWSRQRDDGRKLVHQEQETAHPSSAPPPWKK